MKYVLQMLWILVFSFLGELLHSVVPLPIPASIYGMVLMFAALSLGILKLEQVKETGHFLVNIMAVMFVSPAVGLLNCWDAVRGSLLSVCIIIVVSLLVTFWVSGAVTRWMLSREDKKHD